MQLKQHLRNLCGGRRKLLNRRTLLQRQYSLPGRHMCHLCWLRPACSAVSECCNANSGGIDCQNSKCCIIYGTAAGFGCTSNADCCSGTEGSGFCVGGSCVNYVPNGYPCPTSGTAVCQSGICSPSTQLCSACYNPGDACNGPCCPPSSCMNNVCCLPPGTGGCSSTVPCCDQALGSTCNGNKVSTQAAFHTTARAATLTVIAARRETCATAPRTAPSQHPAGAEPCMGWVCASGPPCIQTAVAAPSLKRQRCCDSRPAVFTEHAAC